VKEKLINKLTKHADLVFVTLLGLILRSINLLKDDFWYDEAFTGNLMRVPWNEFWNTVQADPHPPLYSLVLKAWSFVFGVNDVSLRGFSLIFGVATIVLIYYLTKELFGNKETAALAGFLAAINPFMISYSNEARSYSFYGFLITISAYLIVKKKYMWAVTAMIASVYTHYMAAAFVPILAIFYFYVLWKNKENIVKGALRLIPLALFGLWLYLPVINSPTNNNLNIDWVENAGIGSVLKSVTAYNYGIKSRLAGADELKELDFIVDVEILGFAVLITYILGSAIVILMNIKEKKGLGTFIFSVAMVFVPMTILILYTLLFKNNIYVERYLFPASIFYVISSAYILSSLVNFEVLGALLFIYIFTLMKTVQPYYYSGMKPLAQSYRESQSEVVFTSPIDFVIGKYYLNNDRARLFVPQEPQNTFSDWPFIGDAAPKNPQDAIYITPDETRMTEDFHRPVQNLTFGDYQVWVRKQ
jgi:uncharacterized membrane protein